MCGISTIKERKGLMEALFEILHTIIDIILHLFVWGHFYLKYLNISMQDDFDVDKFVADCRKRVQLEEMREDLEQYYRLLKTAMVELINKDYADFVNLSTNLVSLVCFVFFWSIMSFATCFVGLFFVSVF